MLDVAVVGETVADLFVGLPKRYLKAHDTIANVEIPYGDKISLSNYRIDIGGSGANVAVGLTRLGLDTQLTTFFSQDMLATVLRDQLQTETVNYKEINVSEQTPVSIIMMLGADHSIMTYHRVLPETIKLDLPTSRWLYLGPIHETSSIVVEQVIENKIKHDTKICLNPSLSQIEERSRYLYSLLRSTEVLIVNRHEGQLLTGLGSRAINDDVVDGLLRLGPRIVCLTLGDKGAIAATKSHRIMMKALAERHQIIDTTGAGDGFVSGFLYGVITSENEADDRKYLDRALRLGQLNSSKVVELIGAETGLLTKDEIEHEVDTVKLK